MSLGMKSSSGKGSLQFAEDFNLWVIIVWLSLYHKLGLYFTQRVKLKKIKRELGQDNSSIPNNA